MIQSYDCTVSNERGCGRSTPPRLSCEFVFLLKQRRDTVVNLSKEKLS